MKILFNAALAIAFGLTSIESFSGDFRALPLCKSQPDELSMKDNQFVRTHSQLTRLKVAVAMFAGGCERDGGRSDATEEKVRLQYTKDGSYLAECIYPPIDNEGARFALWNYGFSEDGHVVYSTPFRKPQCLDRVSFKQEALLLSTWNKANNEK